MFTVEVSGKRGAWKAGNTRMEKAGGGEDNSVPWGSAEKVGPAGCGPCARAPPFSLESWAAIAGLWTGQQSGCAMQHALGATAGTDNDLRQYRRLPSEETSLLFY